MAIKIPASYNLSGIGFKTEYVSSGKNICVIFYVLGSILSLIQLSIHQQFG